MRCSTGFSSILLIKMPSLFKTELPMWSPSVDMFETDKEVVVKAVYPAVPRRTSRRTSKITYLP